MRPLITASLMALTVAMLGMTGNADFADAMDSEAAYCARLADGSHSDYLNISEVCDERY